MTGNELELILVEDNENDAELILRTLRKNNLANHIIHVKDGAQALELLFGGGTDPRHTDGAPRVVLLDIKLPKIDGIEILRRMKSDERTKDIPVVILTSSNEERDVKAAYDLGVNSFVTKPIKFADFAKAVGELGVYWLMLNVPPVRRCSHKM